jgi:hypothetical protein
MADMSVKPNRSLDDPGFLDLSVAERLVSDAVISTLVRRHVPLAT